MPCCLPLRKRRRNRTHSRTCSQFLYYSLQPTGYLHPVGRVGSQPEEVYRFSVRNRQGTRRRLYRYSLLCRPSPRPENGAVTVILQPVEEVFFITYDPDFALCADLRSISSSFRYPLCSEPYINILSPSIFEMGVEPFNNGFQSLFTMHRHSAPESSWFSPGRGPSWPLCRGTSGGGCIASGTQHL